MAARQIDAIYDKICLLTKAEYRLYKSKIPRIDCWWWLRSPHDGQRYVDSVMNNKLRDDCFLSLYHTLAIRPVLKYSNLTIEPSKKPNCFMWNEVRWVIIDEKRKMAISEMPIAFDKFDDKSNDYSTSYIRKWLLDWYEEAREEL